MVDAVGPVAAHAAEAGDPGDARGVDVDVVRVGRRPVAAVEVDKKRGEGKEGILASDEGGRGDSHDDARRFANYRIAFMVAGPGVAVGADLYDLNPDDRRDPGTRRTTYGQSVQPVRNGDLANLTLDLLDLDPVPGSEHNSALGLDVSLAQ